MEVYYYRVTIAETSYYQKYLGKVNAVRKKYADLLLARTYLDTDLFSIDNPEIEARSFVNCDQMAIVLNPSHLAEAETKLIAPSWEFKEFDGLNGIEAITGGEYIHVKLK